MSLTSQLITDVFPDLEKVEQLNKEAFPEEETRLFGRIFKLPR